MATFLLIHGACHGGWCWEKVVPLLEARGHKALAPDLPGSGEDRDMPITAISLARYVDSVSKILDKETEPPILVGHSLGGLTITHAAEARRRKVRALVYLTALLPPAGMSGRDVTSREPDTLIRRSLEYSPDGRSYTFKRANVPALFYNDCDPDDVYRAMARLRPQAAAIATTPMVYTEERFGSVPRWYIECLRDNALTLSLQRWMLQQTPCKVLTLDSGHSPFLSMPETLVERLETVAKESVERETIA
ncbi:MAG: alpha/beta fold hydrolase [Alphaproteobacteria bacterium]|nr:alpha/beta fold hydrolase [Alphaproteobacteria bacterium]